VRTVVLVSASAKPGGAERAFLSLARSLPGHGWRPVCVLLEDGPLREWLEPDVVVLPAGRTRQVVRTARAVRAIADIARDSGAAAIVSSLSKTHVYGGAAARLARIPAIHWQHDIPSRSVIERTAARVPAVASVCVSKAAAAAQRGLTPRRELTVVHPPVATRTGDGAVLRARLGWDEAFVVGIVGRLQPWKGQELFLQAAAEIASVLPNARFAVVGGAILGWEGNYPQRLRALANELGLSNCVHFTGHVADVGDWFDALDVVVHASADEPFGLVLVEAMAAGTPVVTVGGGGAAEIVEPGVSALVAAPEPAALARAVLEIAGDAELAARLRFAARERAQLFTPERSAAQFASVLTRVASPTRRLVVAAERTT
jgi:glycosyltransferase involved in cell wall biosynthesis